MVEIESALTVRGEKGRGPRSERGDDIGGGEGRLCWQARGGPDPQFEASQDGERGRRNRRGKVAEFAGTARGQDERFEPRKVKVVEESAVRESLIVVVVVVAAAETFGAQFERTEIGRQFADQLIQGHGQLCISRQDEVSQVAFGRHHETAHGINVVAVVVEVFLHDKFQLGEERQRLDRDECGVDDDRRFCFYAVVEHESPCLWRMCREKVEDVCFGSKHVHDERREPPQRAPESDQSQRKLRAESVLDLMICRGRVRYLASPRRPRLPYSGSRWCGGWAATAARRGRRSGPRPLGRRGRSGREW